VKGDQLMEGGKPFRFISFNIPNLHLVEDNMAFTEENPWRLPDRFEIYDAWPRSASRAGRSCEPMCCRSCGRTIRPGTSSRARTGQVQRGGFRTLDLVLKTANETGVRVIVPFVDNWVWWGGKAEYAAFRGKPAEAFGPTRR